MVQNQKIDIKEELVIQGMLLADDELLVYKDEEAQYHVIATKPYDKTKSYRTLFMTWEDLPKVAS